MECGERKIYLQGHSFAVDNLIITPQQVLALSNASFWHNFANRSAFTARGTPIASFLMVALKMISASHKLGPLLFTSPSCLFLVSLYLEI